MRAAFYTRTGPASEVLEVGEIDTPAPGPGEVLVRVHASGINPSDTKKRAGAPGRTMTESRIVPHCDGAGVIEALGDGVSHDRLGRRVWLFNAQHKRAFGTAAAYIALPDFLTAPLPETTDFNAGACLGVPALTAYYAVTAGRQTREDWVVVLGGAGAVGRYAVQMAKLTGSAVIATVSSAAKADHAQAAGADHMIDYRAEDVAARVREITGGRGADRIIDVNANANAAQWALLTRPEGVVVDYGSARNSAEIPIRDLRQKNITLKLINVYGMPHALREEALQDIAAWLEGRKLSHAVATTYPLEKIAEAHEAVEAGAHLGNIVLTIP
ncbi:MAG: NADPH:quinone reductase [Rhodospirillales bacterium]